MESGIYKITNILDGKIYIGCASNLKHRQRHHFSDLKYNIHRNIHLQRAYNKYGSHNFIFEIIEYCSIDMLNERENYWAILLNVHNDIFGYNIQPTSIDGRHGQSEETKEKIRQKAKLRVMSEEHLNKFKYARKGTKLSKEEIAKRTESRKGYKHSLETKLKISESHKGKDYVSFRKPILQYDLNGNFVKEFEAINKAGKELNGNEQCISRCLKGKRPTAYGYKWKYKN